MNNSSIYSCPNTSEYPYRNADGGVYHYNPFRSGRRDRHRESLSRDSMVHDQFEKYVCTICNREASELNEIRRHVYVHLSGTFTRNETIHSVHKKIYPYIRIKRNPQTEMPSFASARPYPATAASGRQSEAPSFIPVRFYPYSGEQGPQLAWGFFASARPYPASAASGRQSETPSFIPVRFYPYSGEQGPQLAWGFFASARPYPTTATSGRQSESSSFIPASDFSYPVDSSPNQLVPSYSDSNQSTLESRSSFQQSLNSAFSSVRREESDLDESSSRKFSDDTEKSDYQIAAILVSMKQSK